MGFPLIDPPSGAGAQEYRGRLSSKIVEDAAYSSEGNTANLEQHYDENFLKYNTFCQDIHHWKRQESWFHNAEKVNLKFVKKRGAS